MSKTLINLAEVKNINSFKFIRPVGFILGNRKFDLEKNSWRCLILTFIKSLDKDFSKLRFNIFQHFINSGKFGNYLSNDENKYEYNTASNFTLFKAGKNKNIYLNLNLSSIDVINFFLKVFEILKYSKSDLEIIVMG